MAWRCRRALFLGRFQPFHLGHYNALKWIVERESEVVLAIGSAQYSHSLRNPFTVGERLEMVYAVLREEGLLDRVLVTVVPDTDGQHSLWVKLVVSFSPCFDVVYTNDPLSRMLFEEEGFKVESIPFYEREKYEGTRIRRLMAEGGDWAQYVPPAVAEVIRRIHGEQRVRSLFYLEAGGKN